MPSKETYCKWTLGRVHQAELWSQVFDPFMWESSSMFFDNLTSEGFVMNQKRPWRRNNCNHLPFPPLLEKANIKQKTWCVDYVLYICPFFPVGEKFHFFQVPCLVRRAVNEFLWITSKACDFQNNSSSWWFQPLWEILVKLDLSPGKNKKCLKPPPSHQVLTETHLWPVLSHTSRMPLYLTSCRPIEPCEIPGLAFHYTGCLVGILILVYYNPHITG